MKLGSFYKGGRVVFLGLFSKGNSNERGGITCIRYMYPCSNVGMDPHKWGPP